MSIFTSLLVQWHMLVGWWKENFFMRGMNFYTDLVEHPGLEYDPYWATKLEWGCTGVQHVLYCRDTNKFHFVNECDQFDETPYDTLGQCQAALEAYVAQLSWEVLKQENL